MLILPTVPNTVSCSPLHEAKTTVYASLALRFCYVRRWLMSSIHARFVFPQAGQDAVDDRARVTVDGS